LVYNAQLLARRSELVRVIRLQATSCQVVLVYFQARLLRVCAPRAICGLMTTSLETEQRSLFRHAPLDHTQPSIRLIEITPGLSADGLITCGISHATIETEYVCLSYRWGDEDPSTSKTILLDGKLFTVRHNLYDFLHLASTTPEWSQVTQKKYWIDALCINQSDGAERNHQVAQMGRIFANALYVHVWLGRTTDVDQMSKLFNSDIWNGDVLTNLEKKMQLILRYVVRNEYWNRSWIIQEITLARSVIISLDLTTLPLSDFYERIRRHPLDFSRTSFRQFDGPEHVYYNDNSLLSLLNWFRDKHCSVPHDRVFSLLGLCQESDQLKADYDMHWTDLAGHVLRHRQDYLCVCEAALVAKSLTWDALDPDTLEHTLIRRPMLSFSGKHIERGGWGWLHSRYTDTIVPWRKCLTKLILAFGVLFRQSKLGKYIQQHGRPGVLFTEAVREAVTQGATLLPWVTDPTDASYRWYVDHGGWSVGICEDEGETCRVRIALNTLQRMFSTTTLCSFPDPGSRTIALVNGELTSIGPQHPLFPKFSSQREHGHSETTSLFKIEWGLVMEPEQSPKT